MGGSSGDSEARERRWKEYRDIVKIRNNLRDDMKTQCSENFLKYTKGILMRSPNKGRRESYLAISCHQTQLLVPGLGCIQLSCWPRGSHENPQTTQAVANTMGCSMKNDSGAPLLRTTPTQPSGHGEVGLSLHGAFIPGF